MRPGTIARAALEDSFAALVEAALGGDADAQRLLSGLLLPAIRARVRSKIYDLERRALLNEDDIVQATWLRLLEHDGRALRNYDPAISKPLTYVGRIAEKVVIDFARRKQHWTTGHGNFDRIPDPNSSLERRVVAKDQAEKFTAHLETILSERGCTIYALYFLDSQPIREIADLLSVSEQVVYNWVFKIRMHAREFLL